MFIPKFFLDNPVVKYILGGLLIVVMTIVLFNMDDISRKLGFETKSSLTEKVVKQELQTEKAVAVNKDLVALNDIFEKTAQNTNSVTIAIDAKKDDTRKKTDKVLKERKKKLKEAETQLAKPITQNDELKPELKVAMELSGESLNRIVESRINSQAIWSSFCNNNPNGDDCAKAVAQEGA